MTSLKDIAKFVGVSPSTVSIVLNGKAKQKRISDDLAEKITEAAMRMGYQPNRVAVSLRTGKSKTIGLIVENISNNFFSSLAKIVEDKARSHGYNVVYCSTENDPEKGREMIQMLYNQHVDGYLITPASGMQEDIVKLVEEKRPVVLMDRYFDNLGVPYVIVNNYAGMLEGVEYVIKSGAKNIGFVTVDLNLLQMQDRLRAYKDALKKHYLPFKKSSVLTVKYDDTKEQTVKKISSFLKQKKLDAVVFATNYLGIYGLQSIKDLGIKVPTELGVICFDDHDIFELFSPGITVIQQPIDELAKTAVDILISELGHQKASKSLQVVLSTKMVLRGSI